MKHRYDVLPEHLHSTADAVSKFFKENHGIIKIKHEQPIDDDMSWSPTISGTTRDHHLLSVEVTEGSYLAAFDSFIVECQTIGLPLRMYIAFPEQDVSSKKFLDTFKEATKKGVGIVSANGSKCSVIKNAIDLSLASVRRIKPKEHLVRFRQALLDAEATFLNGDPARGCGRIYEELESLTRKIAGKTYAKGYWKNSTSMDFDTHPWAKLLTTMSTELVFKNVRSLNRPLLARVQGLTDHRNQTAHKIRSRVELTKRDRELRTRYEHAVDIFSELEAVAKELRV